MIQLEKNWEVDKAIKKLIRSILDVNSYLSAVLKYIGQVITPQREKELISILKRYSIPCPGLKQEEKFLTNNPYFQNIKLENINYGAVSYEQAVIEKRTLINLDFSKPLGKYLFHYHPLGYFDQDLHLPVLKEGDTVWMSPAISEINSMKTGIKKGHGKCLTMGLGIGVLPYLWLLKDEVKSVTVIEFNKDVIYLFDNYIRPQFKLDKKLKIIHGDAFDYYNEEFLNQFDYVYIDFWESTADGLKYYTKLMEKGIVLEHVDYWIEDAILYDLKYILTLYLCSLYQGKNIADFISSLDNETRGYAKKINLYFEEKNDVIKTEAQLLKIIHNKGLLREILRQ